MRSTPAVTATQDASVGTDEGYVMSRSSRRRLSVTIVLVALAVALEAVAASVGTKPAEAAFPGKNGKIAFTSVRDGYSEIYAMRPSLFGTLEHNLSASTAIDSDPTYSADGKRIAFVNNRASGNGDIYRMRATGASQTRLTFNAADDIEPTWSPSGKKIAFSSGRDGNPEIYMMGADGGSQTRLTFNAGSDHLPSWQPLP
jgi:Tol biopolymer transport system component